MLFFAKGQQKNNLPFDAKPKDMNLVCAFGKNAKKCILQDIDLRIKKLFCPFSLKSRCTADDLFFKKHVFFDDLGVYL